MTIKPTKTTQRSYSVNVELRLNISFNIGADNLAHAVTQAEALKVGDIVDFNASGWDHVDSAKPVILSVGLAEWPTYD